MAAAKMFMGHQLDARQRAVLAPLLKIRADGRFSRERFKEECVRALNKAGCPFEVPQDVTNKGTGTRG